MLTTKQVESFIADGYVRIDRAFSSEAARQCREILWKATGCSPDDPSSWTRPVVRIGELAHPPFRESANTPTLQEAYDQLVGPGNWIARQSLGTFPIRFPGDSPANDTGWHVDASFAGSDAFNFMEWRINIHSRGRALLMLFLFSDVGDNDAPTRIRVGSHKDVAKFLFDYGEAGVSFMELATALSTMPDRDEALATGTAGTVYLCHPFIAHSAQDHKGKAPKFMAQPPLPSKHDFRISGDGLFPIEKAISEAIHEKRSL